MNFKTLIYICIAFVISSCAQFINITGGEQDTAAPELIDEETFPKNRSTNFNSSEILLTFNEYFTVTNPQQKVNISPYVTEDLDFVLKGKKLTIKLNNTLEENTTYTLNFGDAIKDYNAGNVLKNFTYVFSTGNYLDSMRVTGKVVSAETKGPMEDIMVGLYKEFYDSIVSKEKPFYFAKTDKQGYFSLQNIKNGSYKIFALKDENRNLIFDLPNEQIAYQDSIIVLDTSNSDKNTLRLFEQDYKKQKINSKTFEYPGKLSIIFERPTSSVKLDYLNNDVLVLHERLSEEKDTVEYWLQNTPQKRFKIVVKTDSLNDTISIYPYKKPKTNDTLPSLKNISPSIKIDEPIALIFSRPLGSFDTSKISVSKDSVPVTISKIEIDSVNNHMLKIYFKKGYAQRYSVSILPKAVNDIFNKSFSDTTKRVTAVYEKDFFGSLSLKLENTNDTTDYWLSLKQGNSIVKKEKYQNGKFEFKSLPPNKYTLELLVDKNKNGEWDTGDYYSKIKPEDIIQYKDKLEVRSNWELSETWDVSQ